MKIAQRRSLQSHLQAKYRFGSGRAFLLDCGFNANGPCIIPVRSVGAFSVPFGGILLSLLGGDCGEDLMTLDRRKNKRAIRAAKLRPQTSRKKMSDTSTNNNEHIERASESGRKVADEATRAGAGQCLFYMTNGRQAAPAPYTFGCLG